MRTELALEALSNEKSSFYSKLNKILFGYSSLIDERITDSGYLFFNFRPLTDPDHKMTDNDIRELKLEIFFHHGSDQYIIHNDYNVQRLINIFKYNGIDILIIEISSAYRDRVFCIDNFFARTDLLEDRKSS
jgi:hypothetical protein